MLAAMGRHRIALRFDNETPADRDRWLEWTASLPEHARAVAEVGERRPLIAVAAPFPARDALLTARDEEAAGLEIARSIVEAATTLAAATGRDLSVLLSGQVVGRVVATGGPDAALISKLEDWCRLVEQRDPDERP